MNIKRFCSLSFLFFLFFFCISSLKAQTGEEKKDTISAPTVADDYNKIFEKTDKPATPDSVAWRKHIQNGLKYVIIDAMKAGMKAGIYTINVRFVIERDGSITDVHALDDPGYWTKKPVEKIIHTGPKWTPAEINGKKVRSYKIQPVTFKILYNPT